MIDFRYHLVSIVAVFLALAIGIVLGATELQGNAIDLLRASSDLLNNQLSAARAENASYEQQVNANEQFLTTAEPRLVSKALNGDRLVIITEPGASSAVIDGVKQAAGIAGATVTGVVALQPKFNDLSGATQSSLSAINASLASTDGTVLDAPANPSTASQQQAAQLIATAILAKTANQPGVLSATAAQNVLAAYAQDGYLNVTDVSGSPVGPATMAVLVTPQSAPADGQNDPATEVLLAIAQQFAEGSAATLVAGSEAGSSAQGSAISALRSSSVSSLVSSVDDADTTLGQISVIWALAHQAAGGKPDSYGISGASAVSPLPLPVPTASPAASPTPHPTTTRKSGKAVKNK